MQGGQRVRGCVRRKLARDGARGFGFGIGCSGVILMTRDGHRQVGVGRIGVGMVTVVTSVHDVVLITKNVELLLGLSA